MIVLFTLSALALVAGMVIGRRLYPESRSEAALHAALTALALILAPIQALGWTGHLDAVSLGVSVALLSGLAIAIPIARGARPADLARDVLALLRLPLDALREAWRARSAALVMLPATLGLFAWTFWLAWLAPSGSWDGLWYHEPMVGFAIQNRGFELVELPTHLEWVNGYPRTSEHLMLWATIFGDRRLIDGVPSVIGVLGLLAFVCLARAHAPRGGESWRTGAIGLGCVLLTIPGAILQMRSTYIDVNVLAGYVAALHYVSRPDFRARDAWSAGLALGFLGGTKATGIAYVALLGGFGVLRIAALSIRERRASPLAIGLAGAALVALLVLPSYWRNWTLHQNPIWPLRYESRLLGTFEGPHDISNMQWPADQVLNELFGVPTPGQDYHDTRRHAFGYSLSFVGLPLLALALIAMLVRAGRAIADRDRRALGREGLLASALALGAFPFVTSPAYYWARYALPTPAVGLAAVYAWLSRGRTRSFGESVILAMGVLNLITLWWAAPGWDVNVAKALELMHQAPEERVRAEVSNNLMPVEATRLRQERIGTGDVVVFDDEVTFVANFWNERMDNRVLHVPFRGRQEWLDRLGELGAEWVVVRRGSAEERALRESEGRFRMLTPGQGPDVIYEAAEQTDGDEG